MRRLAVAVLSAALGAGCGAPEVGPVPGASIVLITIDTLRADRLPAYGYAAGATPHLDRLASESIVFESVYSHCPLTLPAHASLLTGLLPPRHGVRDNVGFRLGDERETLAERFRAAGFETGAAVSAFVLRAQTGVAQGFAFYDDDVEIEGDTRSLGSLQRDGAAAAAALGSWIEGLGGRRFFAFLHLYEPHAPYSPPERYRHLPHAYDGEIAHADELVGRFLDRLERAGRYADAVVAVTSDHGEGLGDHGEAEHGVFLYREAVQVPLLLRLPGGRGAGRRAALAAGHVDLAATLLDLAGVGAPDLDGTSLVPALRGEESSPLTVYSESLYGRYHFGWSEIYAASTQRLRYVRAPRAELYDLADDPGERASVLDSRAATARALDAWLAARIAAGPLHAPERVPEDVLERLRTLGYVGGAAAPVPDGDLPDPKDEIASYEEYKRALALKAAGRLGEAAVALRRLLDSSPGMVDAWEMLGTTLLESGRTREAAAAFEAAIRIAPTRAESHLSLARLHGLAGRIRVAADHAEVAARTEPGRAHELLAQLMMDAGDAARAVEHASLSVDADPERPVSHFLLGRIAKKQGRCGEALAAYERADAAKRLRSRAVLRDLYLDMGECLARLGRSEEAEAAFLRELRQIPGSGRARARLAGLYAAQGRRREAREVVAGLLDAAPHPTAEVYWSVVRMLTALEDGDGAMEWSRRARKLFPDDPRFRTGG
jgi:arylsulfatase A-like enzyme/Tfp pilus assembly protein PilF